MKNGLPWLVWICLLFAYPALRGQSDSTWQPAIYNMTRTRLIQKSSALSQRTIPPLAVSCDTGVALNLRHQCHEVFLKHYVAQGLFLNTRLAAEVPAGSVLALVTVDTTGQVARVQISEFDGELALLEPTRKKKVARAVQAFLRKLPPYQRPATREGQPVPFEFAVKVPIQEGGR